VAKEVFKNAKIAGYVLVILRYVKGTIKVQAVDGAHVCSPGYGTDFFPQVLPSGNRIINGVELNKAGEHVAYHIKTDSFKTERIEARSKATGLTMAYVVYGAKYRLDNHRGTPVIITILETLKKLERYKEAAVGSAEERQKIVYQIVHGMGSTGESPLASVLASSRDASVQDGLPVDNFGNELANKVALSSNKSTYNMPVNSEMKSLESKNEMFFKEFYGTNCDIMCAAVGIPPNVAFSIYNNSFSASRAAIKDWEQTILVNRDDFGEQFYQPIYNLFLYTECLKNKVEAPGYLKAITSENDMVTEAYQSARFTGTMVPHIDPLKEVNAVRKALGTLADNIPLMTVEQATEILNGGESDENIEQFAEEIKHCEDSGLDLNPAPPVAVPADEEEEEEEDKP
jgi:capsid protein